MPEVLVSYAQNREDLNLYVLLHGVKKGFYVDVGANYPTHDSVTKLFYDRGWNGINIEPVRGLCEQLQTERPRDINLNVGVSDTPGTLLMRQYGGDYHGWSTFSDEIKELHGYEQPYTEHPVELVTLRNVFKKHKVKEIDFLKVDVEGLEFEVLLSNDWGKWQPKVVVVEGYIGRWKSFLRKQGYKNIHFDGLNQYFVRTDLEETHNYNNYCTALLTGQVIMTEREFNTSKELEELKVKKPLWKRLFG